MADNFCERGFLGTTTIVQSVHGIGGSGASCNSFTFEPCNVVVNGNKNKQNVTL